MLLQKIRLFWVTIFFLMYGCMLENKITPNEYGLKIINTKTQFLNTIKADSLKKMVSIHKYAPLIVFDFKYATKNNFTNTILYNDEPVGFIRLEAAIALQKICEELKTQQLGLKIFDAYRPYHVTQKMWQIVPNENYAANPAKGSGHNRGAALDVTLINLTTGQELNMPTAFDDFTEKAHHSYTNILAEQIKNRVLLKNIMTKYGFLALETEWWHYYLPNAANKFELLNLSFTTLKNVATN